VVERLFILAVAHPVGVHVGLVADCLLPVVHVGLAVLAVNEPVAC
jgi:hypothetical protein